MKLFSIISRFIHSLLLNFKNHEFINLLILVIIILIGGTMFYHYLENWRWFDSLYFCVITLTTIGYGDLIPKTDISKLFTIIYIFSGIGIIFGFINAVAKNSKELNDFNKKK